MTYARRTDDNQKEIVAALRKIGCSVAVTSGAGDGFPDIVVGREYLNGDKRNFLIEIKDGSKPPSKQKLKPAQVKLHKTWAGQIAVINCVEDALKLVLEY